MTIKAGVIGIGQRLTLLLQLLLGDCDKGENIQITKIWDSSTDAIDSAMKCIPRFTPKRCSTIEELLADAEISWVLIGSMNCLHAEQIIAAFRAGKHVFTEKPIAISIDDCCKLEEAHEQAKHLKFATGFVLRHAPLYIEIQRLLLSGELGKVVSVEANEMLRPYHGGYIMRNWRRKAALAGPHILEKCCHDLDVLNWLIDSLPVQVASFGGTATFTPENHPIDLDASTFEDTYCAWDDITWEKVNPFLSDKDIVDHQVAVLRYRNGVCATFNTNSCTALHQRRMLICCTRGTIEADLDGGKLRWKKIEHGSEMHESEFPANSHGGGDKFIAEDLAKCMLSKNHLPKASGDEGLRSAVVALAIDEARTTQSIVNLEPTWRKFGC